MTLPIDDILLRVNQASQASPNSFEILLDDSWHQGRTLYGGVISAVLVQSLFNLIDSDRKLVSLSVSFTGPTDGTRPFTVHNEILREGKSVTQATAFCQQNGVIGTKISACFAKSRVSQVQVTSEQKMSLRAPETCFNVPLVQGVTPNFLNHFDLAVSDGEMPYSGSDKSDLSGWMRYQQAPSKFTMTHLVGLIDAWPPSVLQMMPHPGPASTMTWHMSFPNSIDNITGTDRIGYHVKTVAAADGYAHSLAHVFTTDGQLIAISQQTIAIFD